MIPFCPVGCFFTRRQQRLTAANVQARSSLEEIRKTRERREGRYSSERTERREAERSREKEKCGSTSADIPRYPKAVPRERGRSTRSRLIRTRKGKGRIWRSHESACYRSCCQAQNRDFRGKLQLWKKLDMLRCERLFLCLAQAGIFGTPEPSCACVCVYVRPWALAVRCRSSRHGC